MAKRGDRFYGCSVVPLHAEYRREIRLPASQAKQQASGHNGSRTPTAVRAN